MGRLYDKQDWHRTRKHQLTEEPLCRMCRANGILRPATEVDHIIPVSKGGDWYDGNNLQSLCISCHSQKTRADEGKSIKSGCDANGIPLNGTHPWNAR